MTNFFRTVSIFHQNPFINPYVATLRHSVWAFRKIFNLFPCTVRLGKIQLSVPNRAIANGSSALANAMGWYDPNNMFFIKEILGNEMYQTFFDIGANVGVYSLIAAELVAKTKVFAFEPHPYTFSLLNENVRLNNKEQSVSCYQLALGDENGTVLLRDVAGHAENRVLDRPMPGDKVVEVDIRRGDDFCREEGLLPQVIKIDVEGYENHVLTGFSSLLQDMQIIFVECWRLQKTVDILCDGAGFLGPYKIDYKRRRFTHENCNYEDWVFVNPLTVDTLEQIMTFS